VIVEEPGYWDALYRAGCTSWDMGTPTPAIVEVFSSSAMVPGTVLVPGCGSGHDAVWLAQRGHDVTAVDFSAEAIALARQVAAIHHARLHFRLQDLFTLSPECDNTFDYVAEYVTFCAVLPSHRGAFADVLSRVLKPGGLLVALFFPLDERPGGPPFAVQMDEALQLFSRHLRLEHAFEPPRSVTPRKGREMMTLWRKTAPPQEHDRSRAGT
jgi:SAM-dependent methyltransferase